MLMLYLKSDTAKQCLVGQQSKYSDRTLPSGSLNHFSKTFYADVLGIRSEQVASNLFRGFLASDCQPVYLNYTYRASTGSIVSGILRYYSIYSKCPEALLLNCQIFV
ncbi:hypothetical protein Plhal304r1_c091g0171491 [Plasmopara halstedii]